MMYWHWRGATPARQPLNAITEEPMTKRVPVCACGETRASCDQCHKGYLDETLAGREPQFKTVEIPTKRVPVCECGEPRAECATCGKGYVQRTLRGEVPKFKTVPADSTVVASKAPGQTSSSFVIVVCT